MNAALRPVAVAAALAALSLPPAHAEEPEAPAPPAGSIVVRRWLVLDSVDARSRVPFNANAPFLRYLLDRGSPPPRAGEAVTGAKGEAAWREVAAKEDGTVEDGKGTWAYAEVARPEDDGETVWLAHLDGAATLFVNGAGFVGDVYGLGLGPVPVALRAGANRLFVAGPRGPWRLRLEPWNEGRSPILAEDATLPDVPELAGPFEGSVSLRVVNPSLAWVSFEVTVQADPPSPHEGPWQVRLPPLGTGKDSLSVACSRGTGSTGPVRFAAKAGRTEQAFSLETRTPDAPRRLTFTSSIDGSVQFYGCLPPAKGDLPPEKIGTVLSLHGASVDALGQARAYSAKADFRIVCPTNRRPFGFDWQDWGRTDAYEVLDHALRNFGGDPARVFLTGHSMGGHGVWHLAANDPGRWAAIAPSAGWCSFDTYGSGPRPETPLTPIWRACDGGSRTEDRIANLVPIPTLVLHGTKDDNVPPSEAEGMLARIEKAGGKPLRHFQEGAVHWWDGDAAPGADCVDWPGIFDLFRASPPRAASPASRPGPGTGSPAGDAPIPAGPFKRAFDNRFVLVVGTKGGEVENREMLELARYESEVWWYRANGNAPVLRDVDFLAGGKEMEGRNVILFGNADNNAAWTPLIPAGGPVDARSGEVRVGDRTWKGEGLGAVFVRPRPGDGQALVGAFASTGARGTRVAYGLQPFVSGVGYPDYAVFGEETLRSGDGGVLAAGWFDQGWRLRPGGFLREDAGPQGGGK